MKNDISFIVHGRYALFSDPVTRVGGEKCSYHVPTYEALKGIAKSLYWKPTFIWIIEKVRIMNPLRTQTKGVKPRPLGGGSELSIYTYLADVAGLLFRQLGRTFGSRKFPAIKKETGAKLPP